MEITSVINDGCDVVRLYQLDLLRKERIISKVPHKGKAGTPLSPQEWIEHYYKIEGAIEYFEETISSRGSK